MLKAIVYRLYPSKSQQRGLDRTLETCRRWYGTCLAERKDAYRSEQRASQVCATPAGEDLQSQQSVCWPCPQSCVADRCEHLDKAFQAIFRRVKAGEEPGYPRFKGKDRFKSFGFKEAGNGFKVDGRRLKITGIGRVAVRWHRQLPDTVKTLRLTRKAGKWYAVFACDIGRNRCHPQA